MRELLLGGSGRLGSVLRGRASFTAPPRAELDLSTATDAELARWIRPAPAVLNAAAMARVDACEDRVEESFAINGALPGRLARLCAEVGVPLVHLSTDYVFGDGEGPWSEGAARCPVQAYGHSKAAGEVAALEHGATVARVSWLFGATVGPFRDHVLTQAEAGGPVGVFAAQQSRPTSMESLADWLVALLRHRGAGGEAPPILHPAGGPTASRADWARVILDARGFGDVAVVDQGASSLPARRPDDSRLDAAATTAWSQDVGLPPLDDWRDAARRLA